MRGGRSEGLWVLTVWGLQVAVRVRGRREPLEGFEQRGPHSAGSLWLQVEDRLQGGGQKEGPRSRASCICLGEGRLAVQIREVWGGVRSSWILV